MTQKQKENIKHERVLKLKKIGFWTLNIVSYILAGLFLIVLIISLATPKKQNVSPRSAYRLYDNEITEVIREDTPNNVIYDDEEYEITLSSEELNNYTWNNLVYLINNTEGITTDINDWLVSYNSESLNVDELTPNYYLTYEGINYSITLNLEDTYKFTIFDVNDGYSEIIFEYNLLIDTQNTLYSQLKNAIELDIQANESSETQTIFESLTNVLTNFITTLNSGITSVLNLFWDSTNLQLTLLGNLTTIVVGVAVCFFLFRLVIGLIRLRG